MDSDWKLISDLPDFPCQVEIFFGRLPVLKDQKGDEVILPPYRDMRRDLAYWDGKEWCEVGTGHSLFESWRGDEFKPTHYRILGPPPTL